MSCARVLFLLVVALMHRWVPGGSWWNIDAAFLCHLSLRLPQYFAQINSRFFHSGRSVGLKRQGRQASQHCECALRCRGHLGTKFFPVCRTAPCDPGTIHRQSSLAIASGTRTAKHPAISSLAIWRAESHSPYVQALQKLVCPAPSGK